MTDSAFRCGGRLVVGHLSRETYWPTPGTSFDPFVGVGAVAEGAQPFVLESLVSAEGVRWRLVPALSTGGQWRTHHHYMEASGHWTDLPAAVRAAVPHCTDETVPVHDRVHKSRAQRRAEGDTIL